MKLANNIGWCDATGNMVIGCEKVSPGCKNCYAANDTPARVLRSKGIETWGPNGTRHPVKALAAKARRLNSRAICDACRELQPPCHWENLDRYQCVACGAFALRRCRLFADSNSDWLDERWPDATRAALLELIEDCPHVDFLLLTKRPEWFRAAIHACASRCQPFSLAYEWSIGNAPENVWVGVSVEDQQRAAERIPQLLKIPAAVRFLSCEPLLSAVDLSKWIGYYPPNETDDARGTGLSSRGRGSSDDRQSGKNLEGQRKGRERHGPVLSGSSDEESLPSARPSASVSVASFQRSDSSGADDQPSERDQKGQQAGESGIGDLCRASEAREASTGKNVSSRREEQSSQVAGGGDQGDTTKTDGGGIAEVDSSELRNLRQDSKQDRSRQGVGWCIVGGESGHDARPCDVEWIRSLVRQCQAANVPVYVKQLGSAAVEADCEHDFRPFKSTGKGTDMTECPEAMRVREFPKTHHATLP